MSSFSLPTENTSQLKPSLSPITRFLSSTTIIAFLCLAGDQFTSGKFSTGEIVSLLLYGLLLTRPISSLAEAFGQTQRAFAAATRISDILCIKMKICQQGLNFPP